MKKKLKINDLVLLVGGLGTRLRSIISDVPKPMAPVRNKPFLHYMMQYWYDQGIRNFHLLLGYKGSIIKNFFGSKFKDSNIFYYSEDRLAGTGGALKLFLMQSKNWNHDQDFILINGDTWLDVDINQLISDNENYKRKIIIAVKEIPINNRYGTLKIQNDYVIDILPSNNKKAFINSGLYIFKPFMLIEYLFNETKYNFSFETDILPYLMRDKKVVASFAIKKFLDIGIPEDYIKTIDIFI